MDPLDDWKPPDQRSPDGAIRFDNWLLIHNAINASLVSLGEQPFETIPTDLWNLVGVAVDAALWAERVSCIDCRTRLWPRDVIRCLDCKATLCVNCAPLHFRSFGRGHLPET
jgi:hypothetical protein